MEIVLQRLEIVARKKSKMETSGSKGKEPAVDDFKMVSDQLYTLLSSVAVAFDELSGKLSKVLSELADECERLCLSQKAEDRQRTADTVNYRRREMFENNRKPKGW